LHAPNQRNFQSTFESSQFTDHGVISFYCDIYIEAVNLAIGYALPSFTHIPHLDVELITECQGRVIGDMSDEANSNRDEGWAVVWGSDVAARTSNVGYKEISTVPSVPRTCVSTGTSTLTSTSGGGTRAGLSNGVTGVSRSRELLLLGSALERRRWVNA
jgi:hypothetical protein